ncbi:zinc ABC transporter substrate-binding protein, partial [Vibrio parahaemolyticus]|nr:zinc ABC transporter substrate-binding protein [Vibrio parahaemolyticus]
MKKWKVGLFSLLLVSVLGACSTNGQTSKETGKEKLSVITTFYPMYDFTKNIVGDEGEVKLLIPAGTEPH